MPWTLTGNIRGPQGPKGDRGDPGAAGGVTRKRTTSNVVTGLTTYTGVDVLDLLVPAGVEGDFDFVARWDSAATTTGLGFKLVCQDVLKLMAVTPAFITYVATMNDAARAPWMRGFNIPDVEMLSTAAGTTFNGLHVRGSIRGHATTDLILALQIRSEVSGSNVTLVAGAVSTLR